MAVTRVASGFGNNTAAGTNATVSWTRPAGISNGDYEVVEIIENGTSTTLTATGWTVTGPVSVSTGRAWALTRSLLSTDSGTTPSVTLSGAQRWSVSGAVYTGTAGVDQVVSTFDDTSGVSTMPTPAYTPGSANCLAVACMGGIRTFSNTDGVNTWPTGYVAVTGADAVTSNSGGNDMEAALATLQLTGNSLQSSINGTWAGNSRNINFVVVLIPSTVTLTATDFAISSPSTGQVLTITGQIPTTETGAGADSATVQATVSDTDTAAGADSATVQARVSDPDTGAGVDTLTTGATIPAADTGTGLEALAVTASVSMADTAAAVEAVSIGGLTVSDADTGASAEAFKVGVSSGDIGTSGSLTQTLAVSGRIPADDTATATDALTVVAPATLADTATGLDALSILQLAGHGFDTATAVEDLVVVKSDLILFFKAPTPTYMAAVNPFLQWGEPGWDGVNFKVGPVGGAHWNDIASITGVYSGPTDPGPHLPAGTEYVWMQTDGAGTLLATICGIA